ncbi:nickel transporter|nr:nickel transporter [Candidatus Pantoea persica]
MQKVTLHVIDALRCARRVWPLWLLAAALAGAGLALWLYRSQILLQSVIWQKVLHQPMA